MRNLFCVFQTQKKLLFEILIRPKKGRHFFLGKERERKFLAKPVASGRKKTQVILA